jgi:hypothetical protein
MSSIPKTIHTVHAAYHLQCARWNLSMLIDGHHDQHECDSDGSSCEALHDIQRSVSYALEALGEKLCETPIPDSQEYRPAGYVKPLHLDAWYTA